MTTTAAPVEPRYYVIGQGNYWRVIDDRWSDTVARVESRHGAEHIAAEMNAKEAGR